MDCRRDEPARCLLRTLTALLVRRRSEVVDKAWAQGLKLLGCGWSAEFAPVRFILLADTLAREVEDLCDTLDRVLTSMEK